jgi:hypothetical protein
MTLVDLTGRRFGWLTVVSHVETVGGKRRWLCMCGCGGEKVIPTDSLTSGKTKSCGCRNKLVRQNFLIRNKLIGEHRCSERLDEEWDTL